MSSFHENSSWYKWLESSKLIKLPLRGHFLELMPPVRYPLLWPESIWCFLKWSFYSDSTIFQLLAELRSISFLQLTTQWWLIALPNVLHLQYDMFFRLHHGRPWLWEVNLLFSKEQSVFNKMSVLLLWIISNDNSPPSFFFLSSQAWKQKRKEGDRKRF